MQRLKGRLGRLENALAPRQTKHMRVLCHGVDRLANLAKSSCTRHITNGHLIEVVNLDGSPDHLSDAQLEEFIQSFPIQENGTAARKWA